MWAVLRRSGHYIAHRTAPSSEQALIGAANTRARSTSTRFAAPRLAWRGIARRRAGALAAHMRPRSEAKHEAAGRARRGDTGGGHAVPHIPPSKWRKILQMSARCRHEKADLLPHSGSVVESRGKDLPASENARARACPEKMRCRGCVHPPNGRRGYPVPRPHSSRRGRCCISGCAGMAASDLLTARKGDRLRSSGAAPLRARWPHPREPWACVPTACTHDPTHQPQKGAERQRRTPTKCGKDLEAQSPPSMAPPRLRRPHGLRGGSGLRRLHDWWPHVWRRPHGILRTRGPMTSGESATPRSHRANTGECAMEVGSVCG